MRLEESQQTLFESRRSIELRGHADRCAAHSLSLSLSSSTITILSAAAERRLVGAAAARRQALACASEEG